MKRLFIAIPVPDDVRAAVEAIVEMVRAGNGNNGVRWVRMDGLHVTIRFLGPTPDEKVPAVAALLEPIAHAATPFSIRLAGAGAFPSARRPRALWLGIGDGVGELAALQGAFQKPLAALGWPPDDRPFRGHLTLARSDGARGGPAAAAGLATASAGFEATFTADRIVLFESITGHGPARYEPVAQAPLGR